MGFAPRFTITNAITASLTEIERARGFLEAAMLTDAWLDAMRSEAFVREAHHTTHIEGTRLTLEDAPTFSAPSPSSNAKTKPPSTPTAPATPSSPT